MNNYISITPQILRSVTLQGATDIIATSPFATEPGLRPCRIVICDTGHAFEVNYQIAIIAKDGAASPAEFSEAEQYSYGDPESPSKSAAFQAAWEKFDERTQNLLGLELAEEIPL